MSKAATLAMIFCAFTPLPAFSQDEICSRLDALAHAPMPQDGNGKPLPRSFEFHWEPAGIMGAIRCVHFNDRYTKPFCDWLMTEVSREFAEALPERILTCHGFQFPLVPNVESWKAEYSFFSDGALGEQYLEVSHGQEKGPEAIRFTIFPYGQNEVTHPLPTLAGNADEPTSQN